MDEIMHQRGDEHRLAGARQPGHAETDGGRDNVGGALAKGGEGDAGFVGKAREVQSGSIRRGEQDRCRHRGGGAKGLFVVGRRFGADDLELARPEEGDDAAGARAKLRPFVMIEIDHGEAGGRKLVADLVAQRRIAAADQFERAFLDGGVVADQEQRARAAAERGAIESA